MRNIIKHIEKKLQENSGALGLVLERTDSSEITASFGNKKRMTNKNLETLTGIVSDALVASGVDATSINEMELKIMFFTDDDKKYVISLKLEGKNLKIVVEKELN